MNPASSDLVDGVRTYKLFIDGQWVTSSRNITADSYNPADGPRLAERIGRGDVAREGRWLTNPARRPHGACQEM